MKMSAPLTLEERARARATLRIERAMQLIEEAQNKLASACAELSSISGGVAVWKATSKLHDQTHTHWYRIQTFLQRGQFRLDAFNTEILAREINQLNT